jgi:hypothetical protein
VEVPEKDIGELPPTCEKRGCSRDAVGWIILRTDSGGSEAVAFCMDHLHEGAKFLQLVLKYHAEEKAS